MNQELKEKGKTYLVGGVCGAIIILIAGFSVGPLTTNGTRTLWSNMFCLPISPWCPTASP